MCIYSSEESATGGPRGNSHPSRLKVWKHEATWVVSGYELHVLPSIALSCYSRSLRERLLPWHSWVLAGSNNMIARVYPLSSS